MLYVGKYAHVDVADWVLIIFRCLQCTLQKFKSNFFFILHAILLVRPELIYARVYIRLSVCVCVRA